MESPTPKPISPCWKKKEAAAAESAFLDNVKDHLGQFVRASMDEHRICLKKTIRDLREYAKLRKQAKVISSIEGDSGVEQTGSSSAGVQVAAS